MKKIAMLLALCLMLHGAALAQGTVTFGTLEPLAASPNQKLALRSGPGTKYSEIFSIAASSVTDFAIYQQEKGGSAMWGMIEFDSRYGRYRVYTGMKRIDTQESVPMGNTHGVVCQVGGQDVRAYYGPGDSYAPVETLLPAWTQVTVFHEEQGYVMADFILPGAKDDQYDDEKKQLTRAFIPVWALYGYESRAGEEENTGWCGDPDENGWYDWEYEADEVG